MPAEVRLTSLVLTVQETVSTTSLVADLTEVHTWRDLSGEVCARGYEGTTGRWLCWPGVVAFQFDAAGHVDAYRERGVDPGYVEDLFRRAAEPIVRQALGYEALHASAVRFGGGVVALCGERETGKSTLAYSLARRGYRQQSDDAVVMLVQPREVHVLDLPFGVRLRPETAAFYGFDTSRRQVLHDITALPAVESGPVATRPLDAVLVLRRQSEGEPVARRLTQPAAFTALLAHSHSFAPHSPVDRRRLVQNYLEMAASVPVFDFAFSAGLDRLDAVLDCVERTVATGAAA